MKTHLMTRDSRAGAMPGGVIRAGFVVLALVVSLAWLAPASGGEITADNVAQYAASAKTAADYQALAAFYRSQASGQEKRVKEHEAMLASLEKQSGKTYQNLKAHCESIIGASRKLQKDYEAMGAEYEKLAKEAK
jgi:hypothetical protein